MSTNNPIYAPDTLEFVTVAAEYCALLEKSEERTTDEFTSTLLKLLPLVYLKAQLLPDVETDGSLVPDGQVTESDYNFIRDSAYRHLHLHDQYEMLVWDEDMQTDESRWQSVSEGLADIYQALRDFVAIYQQRLEPLMPGALYALRENFELYLGQTMLDTLRQLHRIRYTLHNETNEEDL